MTQDVCVDAGLVLLFENGSRLELTRDGTAAVVERWLADTESISACARASRDFQPCEICPICGHGDFCHALYPLLPVAELPVDADLQSEVTIEVREAVGVCPAQTLRTTLQGAMQSVALLGLMDYCATGKKYDRLFRDVSVIMGIEEIAGQVARNLLLEADGNPQEMRHLADQLCEDLQTTSRGQIRRLRLLCQDHPLIDAVVNTLIILECLIDEEAEALFSEHPLYAF